MAEDIIQKVGEREVCKCPKCGYAKIRLTGTPCEAFICPKCKGPMKE